MSEERTVLRLSPLHNVVFACIFQDEKKAGTAMLEFLNAILRHVGEEPIAEIISMRSEYPVLGESAEHKYGRLDVRVKAESGRLFDIEVQIEKDYINERGFFYGGRMGHDAFESGTPYDEMPEVRVINLVDFYVRDDHSHVVEPVVLSYENNPKEIATKKFKMYHTPGVSEDTQDTAVGAGRYLPDLAVCIGQGLQGYEGNGGAVRYDRRITQLRRPLQLRHQRPRADPALPDGGGWQAGCSHPHFGGGKER